MTEFCDQTKVLDFLSDNGVWVMSYEFELWKLSTELWKLSEP